MISRLTLAGLLTLLKTPPSHEIILLNIYCAVIGLASIAATRSVYNIRDYEAQSREFTTTLPKISFPRFKSFNEEAFTQASTMVAGGESEV